MMNAIPRVDAHHHVWDLTVRDQPWTTELPPLRRSFGFAELRPHLQTHDVDGTVLVQTITVAQETPELLDLAARAPSVRGQLARHANVTCKLSGLVTESDPAAWTVDDLRPYAGTILHAFGPERLMFGPDWPVCLLAASYDQVISAAEELTAGLSGAEREAVFGGTAARAYGLEPA
jgi:predicted TIM-barrel fold metal-dependent hydrolase